jgi:hypothetical protein
MRTNKAHIPLPKLALYSNIQLCLTYSKMNDIKRVTVKRVDEGYLRAKGGIRRNTRTFHVYRSSTLGYFC